MSILGIDLASVSGNARGCDWHAVKAAGISFVGFRLAFASSKDEYGLAEIDRARAAGLIVFGWGFPLLACDDHPTPSAIDRQADAFVEALELHFKPGDLPPAADFEMPGGYVGGGYAKHGTTRAGYVEACGRYVKHIEEQLAVIPMAYTSGRFWHEDLKDEPAAWLPRLPGWFARYPFSPGPAVLDSHRIDASIESHPPSSPSPYHDPAGDADWIDQFQGNAVLAAGLPHGLRCDVNRFNVLRPGAKGVRVRWMQQRLGMAEDNGGVFDDETAAELRSYQSLHGLTADAIVGPKTFAQLCRH